MNSRKKIATIVTLAVCAALAVAGAVVWAESGSTGASSPAAAVTTTTFLSKVASALGIDVSRLEAAIQTAREAEIDEALAAGRITAEEAAAMKERLAAEKAMDQVIADGLAKGTITQDQVDLAGRGRMGGKMGGGLPGQGMRQNLDDSCSGSGRSGR
jgi:hypothetical protein